MPKKSRKTPTEVRRKALKIQQPSGRDLYLFTVSGEELLRIAGISRVSRNEDGRLLGYQRPEVKKHVKAISEYLQSPDMMLAHPLILSFGSNLKFQSSRGPTIDDGLATTGTLIIPYSTGNQSKPAWIVDGQQRALAISLCPQKNFAVPICAFIADDVELQRDQFLRINNSRPLPRGLVTELLPEVNTKLPANLAIRKLPSALCNLLNTSEESPFYGIIRRSSTEESMRGKCVVSDTVVVKMLEDSLTQASGCFFPYRNIATGEADNAAIWHMLISFWNAVKATFPEAWGKPPTQSRLMHGIGIRSLGKLMDRILANAQNMHRDTESEIRRELAKIAPFCRWTKGSWEDLGGIPFNELQNVPKHISMLSNFLVRRYLEQSHH